MRLWARPSEGVGADAPLADESTGAVRRALDLVAEAVIVYDGSKRSVFHNPAAERYVKPRGTDVLVARAVADMIEGAPATRTIDLHGPPPRRVVVRTAAASGGAVAVIEDLSEQLRVDAIRRDFVANVSHELRTPIGALGVLAEALVDEEDPAVIRRLSDRVGAEVARAARLIDELLDLSRIESEEPVARDDVDVEQLLVAGAGAVKEFASQTGVALSWRVDPPGLTVVGDRPQLESAVTNLVDNAVKYSDQTPVEMSARLEGDMVEIAVRDTGVGIPSRDLGRIFERFYRVDRARSRETGGSGLGLAIVRHVATNHGGTVSVDSREGEGSTFTLLLPRQAS